MSIATIRRQVKNVAYNFSDAQVKVREATSNDPWGPSTGLMSEIADLSHNPAAFTEIMSIIWKRMNDHGKNWRHVYKSLVLLDFLIKCGSEKVAQQCRENIFSIETLRDFQHVEEGRDQGMNVREKAKQMATLLADEERLKNERTRFMITRNRFKQTSAVGHDVASRSAIQSANGEYDDARPSSLGEEEMQMQIALALSKEEHERDEEKRKGEDVLYQLAIEESRKEAERLSVEQKNGIVSGSTLSQSALDDLISLGLGEMTLTPVPSSAWDAAPNFNDPWAPAAATTQTSHNTTVYPSLPTPNDPWAPAPPTTSSTIGNDPFGAWDAPPTAPIPAATASSPILADPFSPMTALPPSSIGQTITSSTVRSTTKTPENFLGDNASLVNLNNLMGTMNGSSNVSNPFLLGSSVPVPPVNPFTATQRKSPTLNEMRAAGGTPTIPPSNARPVLMPQVLQPTTSSSSSAPTNPFANF